MTELETINVLDLFSGAGGFSLGIEKAGIKANHYFSEIDKHAIAVYKQNFKEAQYVGSVTDVRGADLPRINLITFGSPCQDFSLAGERSGMGGERSSLISEAIRLVDECRPDVFVWENVKGVYSSNEGRDFQAILRAFTDLGGYRLEWQLLDTKWFLPQSRQRVYLVGHLGERGWRPVFPFRSSDGIFAKGQGGEAGERQLCSTITRNYWRGVHNGGETYVIASQRGRPSEDGYDQQFEIRDDGSTNTLTGVEKDNFVVVAEALKKVIDNNDLDEGEVKALDLYNHKAQDHAPALQMPNHNAMRLYDGKAIRRLTPIECERLQGFPDGHTAIGNYDGEELPVADTNRYRLMGNAVSVPVIEAIMNRLYD